MTFDPQKHRRRSIRLPAYDYRLAGAYFVTICTQNRECLFGDVIEGHVQLTAPGKMIEAVWRELPEHYSGVALDEFVVMPNHVHGIILLVGAGASACPHDSGQPQGVAPTLSLPNVVHRFKSFTTARYRQAIRQIGWPSFDRRLWQRNYYEHVLRGQADLDRIRRYIAENSQRWAEDPENPNAVGAHGHAPLHDTPHPRAP